MITAFTNQVSGEPGAAHGSCFHVMHRLSGNASGENSFRKCLTLLPGDGRRVQLDGDARVQDHQQRVASQQLDQELLRLWAAYAENHQDAWPPEIRRAFCERLDELQQRWAAVANPYRRGGRPRTNDGRRLLA
jgi:hypothetical protein